MRKEFLTAEWNNLIMANYIVDASLLSKYIPPKTELDLYKGNVYVSLIGFMFEQTRLLGIRIPFHANFEEVNLRFYVRYFENGQWKRGAVFIKEIVPKAAISFVANNLYKEKYITVPMKHSRVVTAGEIRLQYQWKFKNKWNSIAATTNVEMVPMLAGSEEEFIAEHYWGYSKFNAISSFEYAVQHPAWKVYPVKSYEIDCDFVALYGTEFSCLQNAAPASVFVAAGSAISILHKKKL